jgi:hypothetical protein
VHREDYTFTTALCKSGLTVCVSGAGADGGTPSKRKRPRRRKMLENAQNPQRPLHAVLGGSCLCSTNILISNTLLLIQNGEVYDIFMCAWSVDIKAIVNRCLRFPQ